MWLNNPRRDREGYFFYLFRDVAKMIPEALRGRFPILTEKNSIFLQLFDICICKIQK